MIETNKAVFLDRDGVINKEKSDYVKNISELEIFPDVAESIMILKKVNFLIVVITNQSAINRGLMSHKNVNEIHEAIQVYLNKKGTSIDNFYYCPHRPDENCTCRKPKVGLILRAADEMRIDLKSSWMIGNNESDIQAAETAGCKGIKIDENFVLQSAVQSILNSSL